MDVERMYDDGSVVSFLKIQGWLTARRIDLGDGLRLRRGGSWVVIQDDGTYRLEVEGDEKSA